MNVTRKGSSQIGSSGGSGSLETPTSTGTASTTALGNGANISDVIKSGSLRKWKGKKKFFVLRKETDQPARLEYYANERKFRMGQPPKK